MIEQPVLETARLILRPFRMSDAKDVQRLAGDERIAATTANIPHPYGDGVAEQWIAQHPEWFARGENATLAIVTKSEDQLIGCITLFGISKTHRKGELGYWIGVDFWNRGYCSEAASRFLEYAFAELDLNRVSARHLDVNPASGRVMLKIGFKHEGRMREDAFKNGRFADVEYFGILRGDFQANPTR